MINLQLVVKNHNLVAKHHNLVARGSCHRNDTETTHALCTQCKLKIYLRLLKTTSRQNRKSPTLAGLKEIQLP